MQISKREHFLWKIFHSNRVLVVILIQFPGDSVRHQLHCLFECRRETVLASSKIFTQFLSLILIASCQAKWYCKSPSFSNTCSVLHPKCYDNWLFLLQPWAYWFLRSMYRLNFVIGNEQMVDSLSIRALLKYFFLLFLSFFASNAAFGRLNGTTFKRKLNSTHHERSKWSAYEKNPQRNEFPCPPCFCCCQLDTIAININEYLSMYCTYTPLYMVWWRKKQQFVIDRVV